MEFDIEPGVYVAAVSGGVDSMVLLDLLQKKQGVGFVVAHFDHGMREDSELDREFVHNYALDHGLAFVFDKGNLGADASEAKARKARYAFLNKVKKASGARAVLTAHHQDDVIETAIVNLLRGTGRKGLSSLSDNKEVKRPLLKFSKQEIVDYAKKYNLKWREDPSNQDLKYKRNQIRHGIVKSLSESKRQKILDLLQRASLQNKELDEKIANLLQFIDEKGGLKRRYFAALPHKVALEVAAAWLRTNNIRQFDKKLLEKITNDSKTLKPGKRIDIDSGNFISVSKEKLTLETIQR